MNYLDLILKFWQLDATWQFSCCESRLYFYLIEQANRLGWPDNFTHSDARTSINVGVSQKSLRQAKNRLLQAGLISFSGGGSGRADKCKYLFRCSNLPPKVSPKVSPLGTPKGTPKGTPNGDDTSYNTDKLNKTDITPYNPPDGETDNFVTHETDRFVLGKEKVARKRKESDISLVEPSFQPIVADWLAYKSERGQTYRQRGFEAFYDRLQELSSGSADTARQIIQQSMANNWAGIFALKTKNHERSKTNKPPSPDELARAVAEGIARANTLQEWEL